ncbi:MAG: hypothetical protein A3H52_01605 [Candidatus Zambryskibacteria bacterium RIFCSPLOWO2_02_FULL_39_26]|uniref:Transcriptional repressor PaaX-like central Cas2-like domain-containing protein n=1 Tax=Candidatus Zambryskibacteria bacterium RIFCSPLOWO2_12_FULL_39_23 TaxID=1802776 RepID=A0A1G2URK2_9BACT|nr:MAG: hypothetical protein A2W51_01200 [Candidatus Zambryskibacteria bacterium RIFCSPHIGHO2_02_39_10]OHA99316.1 MAG: hypothetical protein A3E59_00355 [Candidatus Zambryskibacteria bacterium RIFCSPHIGHO2_12_FULL_39_47]OHB10445.1 MAG: hypothetical protein A3H52_01605 [Candidatus Zambryskibacteria bacterium RIFCSPLOWO2_02_FULL_39_26]OHB12016.1 MAG: hypothetical protein A3G99_02950 [Candidatus Zambryskibacteria bacterium RIFCSPLOWO2_12_FULL_39_23]
MNKMNKSNFSKIEKHGVVHKKIILLLQAGIALSLTRSPRRYLKIIEEVAKNWREIEKRALYRAIVSLYKSQLIDQRTNKDGTITFILTKEGKKLALTFNLEEMKLRKGVWDKKWRIVIFDIPEKLRKIRDSLRYQLKRLEFYEFQKSVFVTPFPCDKEIDYIVEFYNIRRFVRFIEATSIDSELDLKRKFNLI